jgi:hypothetical protein
MWTVEVREVLTRPTSSSESGPHDEITPPQQRLARSVDGDSTSIIHHMHADHAAAFQGIARYYASEADDEA